jgi:hypothetical protein
MKSIFTTALFFVILVFSAFAQPSLTYKNHSIVAGNSHHFYIAQSVDKGSAGPNQTWDFSNLKKQSEMTSIMLNASETLSGASIPEANSVIREFDNNFYFKVTRQSIEEYGYATANGTSVFKYDKPLIKMKFPFPYGSTQEGDFHGVSVNDPKATISGSYKIEADAYGKLILPGNISVDNVIRLKSTRTNISGTSSSSIITYRWYSTDVRYPLLTIIESENAGKIVPMVTAYYPDLSATLKSAADKATSVANEDLNLSVFPVPFSNKLTISYSLSNQKNVIIELTDNAGKIVHTLVNKTLPEGSYSETVFSEDYGLTQGVYFIRAIINGKVTSKKVVKI